MTGQARLARWLLPVSGLLVFAGLGAWVLLTNLQAGWPAVVNVRWTAGVDTDQREQLEQLYRLTARESLGRDTFAYLLTNPSSANVRALVENPAVDDTHDIDRTAMAVAPSAYRVAPAYAGPLSFVTAAALLLGGLGLALAAAGAYAPARTARWVHAITAWPARCLDALRERIPSGSPESAAAFRVVFGTGVLALVTATNPSVPTAGPLFANDHLIALQPMIFAWIEPWLAVSGVLFIAGALTHVAFPTFAAGVLVWIMAYATGHPTTSLAMALVFLLPSRWSDAWSVDAWWRARRGDAPRRYPSHVYGYTPWVPGVVLGVTFAAAAVAKLRESGVAWVLNGTVKYHLLTHSEDALMGGAEWLGRFPALAVLASLCVIAGEAWVLFGAFSRRPVVRAATGAVAVLILGGFLFGMGLFWPGWWLLALSFLPWQAVRRAPAAMARVAAPTPTGRRLAAAQAAAVVTLLAVQLTVSAARIEAQPVLSAYDMYANTYGSRDAYSAAVSEAYWLVGGDSDADRCSINADDVSRVRMFAQTGGDADAVQALLARCFPDRPLPEAVHVEALHRTVDWQQWRLAGAERSLAVPSTRVDPATRPAAP